MRWGDLRRGDVFVSKRSEKVRLVLDADGNGVIALIEYLSLTTERLGRTIKGAQEEVDPEHYEVIRPGGSGQA